MTQPKPVLHPWKSTEEFTEELRGLAYLVARYGIDRFKPHAPADRLGMIKFCRLVHEGWKLAQNKAVRLILDLTEEIAELKALITSANKRRDRKSARELEVILELLELRRRKVQHAMNAVVWGMVGNQHHVVRRFAQTPESGGNFNPKTLFDALAYSDEVNRDPNMIAVLCDLTTFMHVGDVLVLDSSYGCREMTVVELKGGTKNERCRGILDQFLQTGCERNFYFNIQELSDSERKQVKRMIRQELRGHRLIQVLNTGVGTDISTGHSITIPEKTWVISSFNDQIVKMADELRSGKTWAIGAVSECLFLGLYSDPNMGRIAFDNWMSGMKLEGPRLDYMSVFDVSLARPTLSLGLSHDLVTKLYTGEWHLCMALDVPRWMDIVKAELGTIEFEGERNTRKLLNEKWVDMFVHNGRALRTPSGHLGTGLLSKIFYDFYDPVDAMRPYFEGADGLKEKLSSVAKALSESDQCGATHG